MKESLYKFLYYFMYDYYHNIDSTNPEFSEGMVFVLIKVKNAIVDSGLVEEKDFEILLKYCKEYSIVEFINKCEEIFGARSKE